MSRGNVLLCTLFCGWILSSFTIGALTVQKPPIMVALEYLEESPPDCLTDSECNDLASED